MSRYYVHDATGKIVKTGACQSTDVGLQAGVGEVAVVGDADAQLHYVLDGEVTLKGVMTAELHADNLPAGGAVPFLITPLPNPTQIHVFSDGDLVDSFIVIDGSVELTFDAPGEYLVLLQSTAYLDHEVTLHAT